MTTPLLSLLLSEAPAQSLGGTTLQTELMKTPVKTRSITELALLHSFWSTQSSKVAAPKQTIVPAAVLAVLSGVPEVQDASDDYFI